MGYDQEEINKRKQDGALFEKLRNRRDVLEKFKELFEEGVEISLELLTSSTHIKYIQGLRHMLKVNGPDHCINQWLNKAEEYELGVGWSDAIYETLDFNEMKPTKDLIEPTEAERDAYAGKVGRTCWELIQSIEEMNMEKYREGPPTSTMRFLLCNKYCRVSMWDVQTKGCGDTSNFSQEATFQQVFIGDDAKLARGEKMMIFEKKGVNTNLPYAIAHQAKLENITALVFSYDEGSEEVNLQKFCIDKRLKRDDCCHYQSKKAMEYITRYPDEFLIVVDCLSKPAVLNRHVPLVNEETRMKVADQLCTLVTGMALREVRKVVIVRNMVEGGRLEDLKPCNLVRDNLPELYARVTMQ